MVPDGARICASPPSVARKPRPPKGLLRQASENHEIELGARSLHLAQHERDIDHLEINISLPRGIGADGHKIVGAAYLDAMARVVESSLTSAPWICVLKSLHSAIQAGFVEIDLRAPTDQRKAKAAQRIGHEFGVINGIIEPRNVLVGAVANDQRHAATPHRRQGGDDWRRNQWRGSGYCDEFLFDALYSLRRFPSCDKFFVRIEAERNPKIGQRPRKVTFFFIAHAAVSVRKEKLRPKSDCLVQFSDSAIIVTLFIVIDTETVADEGVLRLDPTRFIQVHQRPIIAALLCENGAARDVRNLRL